MAYNHLPYSIWTVRFIDLLRYWIAFLILPTGYISTHFFTKKSCLTIWFVSSASLQLNLPLNLWKYADNTIFRLFLMWKNKSKRDHQGGYLKVFIRPSPHFSLSLAVIMHLILVSSRAVFLSIACVLALCLPLWPTPHSYSPGLFGVCDTGLKGMVVSWERVRLLEWNSSYIRFSNIALRSLLLFVITDR